MDQKEALNLSVLKSGFQKSSWPQIVKVIAHLQVCGLAPLCLHFFQQMSHGLDSAIILVGFIAMSKSPPYLHAIAFNNLIMENLTLPITLFQ